ncbi:putative stomatal cytokinesis defective protein [Trifolium medium]|uniref:Putative stomatal cytokinesis defective protein n=1 Tax=Trifolium medium TaxID=97028 RepID=A0A392Q264_9FABA|nr:putative stomatal cytokinesis defective protein [Trifolium medium]
MIESDAEGIGGSGFVECIREHMHSGWHCQLTEEQFIAVKELVNKCLAFFMLSFLMLHMCCR